MTEIYSQIRRKTVTNSEIAQQEFLTQSKFSNYCKDYGLSLVSVRNIEAMWWHGLLQADLVCSSEHIDMVGLELIENNAGVYTFADNRTVPVIKDWGGCLTEKIEDEIKTKLYFHPFRLYAMYHIQRIFSYNLSPIQHLLNNEGAKTVENFHNDRFEDSNTRSIISEKITKINNAITLAVFCEPYAYSKVYNKIKISPPDTEVSLKEKIKTRTDEIENILSDIGINEIEKIRSDICFDVEVIDPNKMLHILLRMMNSHLRQGLKGKIGGAMLLFSMAEFLRLSTEYVFKKKLPEEDELGFGVWMKDVKKDIFGANRLYDSDSSVKREFFRQYGADHSTKVRCYFEGETEYGAFNSLFGLSNRVDLINLKGNVVEKGGKGVAFRESLRTDIKNKVFSIIVIDADRDDYVRAVQRACEDDEICGRVFFLEPDFEFGNFTLSELTQIIRRYAIGEGASDSDLEKIDPAVANSNSGKKLEQAARNSIPELVNVGKGEEWGNSLLEFALNQPEYPSDYIKSGQRVIVEVAELLLRAVSGSFNYNTTRSKFKVDPITGELVLRNI